MTVRATIRSRFCAEFAAARRAACAWSNWRATSASIRRLLAGFRNCRGDIVVTLDADLQNPPEEIPRADRSDRGRQRRRRRMARGASGPRLSQARLAPAKPPDLGDRRRADARLRMHAARVSPPYHRYRGRMRREGRLRAGAGEHVCQARRRNSGRRTPSAPAANRSTTCSASPI